PTRFPYTTLFRSSGPERARGFHSPSWSSPLLPNFADLPVVDERDAPLGQRTAYARVAKGAQVGFPLLPIACDVAFIHIARVTAQLGDAVPDLRPDNLLQVLNADLLRVRLTAPLTVKFRDIPDGR